MNMNTRADRLTIERCVVRNTAAGTGRHRSVAPGATAARHLHYGRIILGPTDAPIAFETDELETGLICLKGAASIRCAGRAFELVPYDTLYVPRDSRVEVAPDAEGGDLAEISAPVASRYPLQFVRYADVLEDLGLHFTAGAPPNERRLSILLGKNVEAGRILAGVTFSTPGNWTSWPPHEHAALAEEAYLYIDMPHPAFGIQMVYTNLEDPELAVVVREGDCVLMPEGYHPNVGAPGGSINFVWMMAAKRELEDRQFGVVNVQPEYAAAGSGIDAGRARK
jgi:5-deoxy-glucuronate isomerase